MGPGSGCFGCKSRDKPYQSSLLSEGRVEDGELKPLQSEYLLIELFRLVQVCLREGQKCCYMCLSGCNAYAL